MIQNVVSHIGGVGLYGIVSICLFFAVFSGAVLWAIRLSRSYRDEMRVLPLEDDDPADASTPRGSLEALSHE
jgi:hypothetical protein